jgi:hypothetical protein
MPMLGLIDCRPQGARLSGSSTAIKPGWGALAPEMLEFFDRPLLQHAVEQMVVAGVTHCVLITADTSTITERWAAGERWGCTFSAIKPQAVTAFLMEQLAKPAGRPSHHRILVGRADCIPLLPRLAATTHKAATQLIFSERKDEGLRLRQFTGWALTDPHRLLQYCFPTQGAEGLLSIPRAEALQVALCLRAQTPGQFLRSQELILDAFLSSALVTGTEIKPGVWAAHSATLHPSAQVSGKIYLGENVRIGKAVTLHGPLVVCRNSVVDMNADLEDVSVQPGVYVGKGTQRHGLILPRSFLRAEWSLRTLLSKRGPSIIKGTKTLGPLKSATS